MDENKIIGMLRTSFYESELVDLLRELMQKLPIPALTLKHFKDIPIAVQDYLEGHVTAWALFELLLRLPTFRRELDELIQTGGVVSPGERGSSPTMAPILRSHDLVGMPYTEMTLHEGPNRRAVAVMHPGGSISVHTPVHISDQVTARVVRTPNLHLMGRGRSRITLEDGRRPPQEPSVRVGETPTGTEYFIFRCFSCGGVFLFEEPMPRMHMVEASMLTEEPEYVCSRCYRSQERKDG